MHPSVTAAIAIALIVLLVLIIFSLIQIWRRCRGGGEAGGKDGAKKVLVDGNELEALVKAVGFGVTIV